MDECATDNDECDLLALASGPSCVNADGTYSCGECPLGFINVLTVDQNGRNNGSFCDLPPPDISGGSGAGAQVSVQPTLQLVLEMSAAYIGAHDGTYGGGAVEALTEQLQTSISLSTGLSTDQFTVTPSSSGRRQMQEDSSWENQLDGEPNTANTAGDVTADGADNTETQEISLDIVMLEAQPDTLNALASITSQLTNASSPLRSQLGASVSMPPQELAVAYSCPEGSVLSPTDNCCYRYDLGQFSPGAGQSCRPCPAGQTNNLQTDGCICQAEFYGTGRAPKCQAMDYFFEQPPANPCLELKTAKLSECVDEATGDALEIAEGWSALINAENTTVAIFSCRNPLSCPAGTLDYSCAGFMSPCNCTTGYTGILCGNCAPEYALKPDASCEECVAGSTKDYLVVFCAFIVVMALVSKVDVWYQYFTVVQDVVEAFSELKDELWPIAKNFIALMQILGGMSSKLNVSFSQVFDDFIKAFIGYFKFDIALMFETALNLGCLSDGRFATGLMASMVVFTIFQYKRKARHIDRGADPPEEALEEMRIVFAKFDEDGGGVDKEEIRLIVDKIDPSITDEQVDILFKAADTDGGGVIDFDEFFAAATADNDDSNFDLGILVKKEQKLEAGAAAFGRLFLVAFLLYPGLTAKIFESFACRDLGPNCDTGGSCRRLLVVDCTIDCESPEFLGCYVTMLPALLALWPIGLPLMLFMKMVKVRKLILECDEDTLKQYGFVLDDCKTTHWYWEVVELGRKLTLAGLIGVVGRGTALVATLIAFWFFAISFKERPFKKGSLNKIKSFSEFQLFAVLLICTVMQSNSAVKGFSDEIVTVEGYGEALKYLTLMILPLTVYFFFTTTLFLPGR